MKNLPIIFCIDDDAQVLSAVIRDLKQYYKDRYKILGTISPVEALESLSKFKNKGETVAIFISDHRMPDMNGIDFLSKTKNIFPDAKKVLLTAYSEKDIAILAINEIGLNYYLVKPWDPPEERLYPVIDDLLEDWQANYIPDFLGIRIVGHQYSKESHDIKHFLANNIIPYKWLDIADGAEGSKLLVTNGFEIADLPVVIYEDGSCFSKPTIAEIAAKIGLNSTEARYDVYDVIIIGAGPAGLGAAVYGASEGLKTLLIERWAPGGQAGTSSRIENYLGFPAGLSGSELTRRAMTQATRLGMEFLSPQLVVAVEDVNGYKKITLENGKAIITHSVIITTGVDYRKHEASGIDQFIGAGVYYGAALTEAAACKDGEVYIAGGGNSAGQTAMYLSKFARNVHIVVRKGELSSSMSAYLIDQIKATPNIFIIPGSVVTAVSGSDRVEHVEISRENGSSKETKTACAFFIFVGAKPYTDWLDESILKDERGFIETGLNVQKRPEFKKEWKLARDPYLLETSVPGVFAAGDVRAGAMNRVASAVGEGSMAISFVHRFLAEVK